MRHPSNGSAAAVTNLTPRVAVQPLTLIFEGGTAEDSLDRVRDPEPPALGHTLKSLTTRAAPLGDRVHVELVWDHEPPAPWDAALTAGFPLTPEVVGLHADFVSETS